MALVEDSLLCANGLSHHGEHVPEDEELAPSCGLSLVWFQVSRGPYAYLTCQRSLVPLSATSTSAKPSPSLNLMKFQLLACLLLSKPYHPPVPVTLHPFR